AMFAGELFSDFLLMFALLHQSRFERLSEDGGPGDCWAERWRVAALDRGVRALDLLRDGVVAAIDTLGTGFLRHPDNRALREALRTGGLRDADFQRCLLRLVYRVLFWFVAEDRDALHPARTDSTADTAADTAARDRYARYFSAARLRRAASRRFGTAHSDRWHTLRLTFGALGGAHGTGGVPALGLPALGGVFESGPLDGPLDGCELANTDLLAAVRHLSVLPGQRGGPRRRVDYRDLDSEELGSVYESLLEYLPRIDPDSRTFRLAKLSGNERKSTGSYYTPSSLIECLLDSALDPVLDDAVKAGDTAAEQEAALLAVTVCDPACGSGHFLVAAARRIARRLAVVRTGELEPSPDDVRRALHDVVGSCVYGVDINPLAVELARVSLWLEALEPGRPLGFLDAHVRVGNSLLGVTPALLAGGLPDAAFKPIEGDDRGVARALARQNAKERQGQLDLFAGAGLGVGNAAFGAQVRQIAATVPDRLDDVHVQRQRYEQWRSAPDLARRRQVADAWCAAFVWRKADDAPTPVTHQTLLELDADPDRVAWWIREEVDRLAGDYRFFHWHLEFPEIFAVPDDGASGVDGRTGWAGGFSCLLGNPPWERVKLQEQEFFAARDERIAKAPNAAARRKLIAALAASDLASDRALHAAFAAAKRQAEGVSHLLRDTGRFPLTGRGDVNTYAVFAETATLAVGPHGRFGMVLPTGIATDATTQYFFRDLVESKSLAALYDFENRRPIFPAVDSRFKFCLLTMA
ncbi:MAG TPA: DNA methyltransferase, partial [Mycobacteriales bacterium]|nr:DNA methyltransferase [Mycobacteriales bacterium]